MTVCVLRSHPPPGRPVNQPVHQQIRLIHILQRPRILPQGRRQGIQPHRAARKLLNHHRKDIPVVLIQTQLIHIQDIQGKLRHFLCDHPVILYLGKIPDPP